MPQLQSEETLERLPVVDPKLGMFLRQFVEPLQNQNLKHQRNGLLCCARPTDSPLDGGEQSLRRRIRHVDFQRPNRRSAHNKVGHFVKIITTSEPPPI